MAAWLPASLMKIQSKMNVLLCPQHFLHYKYIRKYFGAQGQVTSKWIVRSGPKSNSLEILLLSCLPASYRMIRPNWRCYRVLNFFPIISLLGNCLPWKPEFWSNLHQNLKHVHPYTTQAMLHVKFDENWPTGLRDIQVWKCGRRRMTTDDDDGRMADHCYIISHLVSLRLRWAYKRADT